MLTKDFCILLLVINRAAGRLEIRQRLNQTGIIFGFQANCSI
jgi:hypothetical protein